MNTIMYELKYNDLSAKEAAQLIVDSIDGANRTLRVVLKTIDKIRRKQLFGTITKIFCCR